jgi:hypothetical protein
MVDDYWRGVAGQFPVHDEGVAVRFLGQVAFSRLVQSQPQLGAASAGRGEDANGRNGFAFEVSVQFRLCGLREFNVHMLPPVVCSLIVEMKLRVPASKRIDMGQFLG